MIIFKESSDTSKFNNKFLDIIDSQGYTIDVIINGIADTIIEDEHKYPNINISCSDGSDVYDESAVDNLKEIISDIISEDIEDEVISEFESGNECDVSDLISNIFDERISEDDSEIRSLDNDLQSNYDRQKELWQDDMNDLNKDYWDSRI